MKKQVPAVIFVILFSLFFFSAGCSSSSTTKKTTVTTEPRYTADGQPYTQSTTSETVETEESDGGGCGGILSCTVEVVGNVLALPFRLVGALVDVIF